MSIGKSRYSLGCCGTPPCACASARWLCSGCANAIASTTIIDSNHVNGFISILLVNLFATRRGPDIMADRKEACHLSAWVKLRVIKQPWLRATIKETGHAKVYHVGRNGSAQ